MPTPPVSSRVRDAKKSPIREILKLAERKNIIDMGLDPDDVISFAGGWVNHESPAALREEYRLIADDAALFHELGSYSPTRGIPKLRAALLRLAQGIQGLADENLIVGQSSTQLTHNLFTALLNPGDRVVLLDPSYANYGPQIGLGPEGLEILWLRAFDPESWSYIPDPERLLSELEAMLDKEKPRLMLFSSPDNPTSQLMSDDVFYRIVDMTARAGCFVVLDLAYEAQCFDRPDPDHFSASPTKYPNLVRIHSNSKWCRGLGRRLGWIEAAPEVVQALEVVQQAMTLCGDTMHQYALASYYEKALEDGSLQVYLDKAREDYRKAADVTCRCVEEHLGFRHTKPRGGLYTVVDVERDGDAFVREVLTNTGVIFVPGSGFGPSLKNGVRVSYGPLVHDLERIEAGFGRVGAFLGR